MLIYINNGSLMVMFSTRPSNLKVIRKKYLICEMGPKEPLIALLDLVSTDFLHHWFILVGDYGLLFSLFNLFNYLL